MTNHQAATIYAYAWKSDSHAYKRARHDLDKGHILQSDLVADAYAILNTRGNDEVSRAIQLAGF